MINADGSGIHAFGLHGLNGEPTWSPDGRRIVWGDSGGFAIANADGSGLRHVKVPGWEGHPVFSPDGRVAGLGVLEAGHLVGATLGVSYVVRRARHARADRRDPP